MLRSASAQRLHPFGHAALPFSCLLPCFGYTALPFCHATLPFGSLTAPLRSFGAPFRLHRAPLRFALTPFRFVHDVCHWAQAVARGAAHDCASVDGLSTFRLHRPIVFSPTIVYLHIIPAAAGIGQNVYTHCRQRRTLAPPTQPPKGG